MFEETPSSFDAEQALTISPYITSDSKELHESAMRAVDYYLKPGAREDVNAVSKPSPLFMVAPDANYEALLAQICESMTSAKALVEVAAALEGTPRKIMVALQQIIMPGEMAANRMLDNFKPDTGDELTPSASAWASDGSVTA